MKTKQRIITSIPIRIQIRCKKCDEIYDEEIKLPSSVDTYLQLGNLIRSLNMDGIILLQVTDGFQDKVEIITEHLIKQGNYVKKWGEKSVAIKDHRNLDTNVVEIKKGVTSSQIIDMCKDMMVDEPKYKDALLKLIENINGR